MRRTSRVCSSASSALRRARRGTPRWRASTRNRALPGWTPATGFLSFATRMPGLMDGKAGLVTGAASGIGRACAIRFAAEGAAVVVADLELAREGAEETVRLIEEAGGRAQFFAFDVASSEANEALVARVVGSYGRLDFAHN